MSAHHYHTCSVQVQADANLAREVQKMQLASEAQEGPAGATGGSDLQSATSIYSEAQYQKLIRENQDLQNVIEQLVQQIEAVENTPEFDTILDGSFHFDLSGEAGTFEEELSNYLGEDFEARNFTIKAVKPSPEEANLETLCDYEYLVQQELTDRVHALNNRITDLQNTDVQYLLSGLEARGCINSDSD